MTQSRIEPANFWLVAHCLIQLTAQGIGLQYSEGMDSQTVQDTLHDLPTDFLTVNQNNMKTAKNTRNKTRDKTEQQTLTELHRHGDTLRLFLSHHKFTHPAVSFILKICNSIPLP
jgi:hypothetical protein